jgi:hypothetical protein
MNAVFIHQDSVLRDSHIDPESPIESWHLAPATLEALRTLASATTFVLLYGPERPAPLREGDAPRASAELRRLAAQIEAGGGRVDALITCTQQSVAAGRCYGDFPGLVWAASARFSLRPEACYLLGDSVLDLQTALSAGVRPFLILSERTIEDVFGRAEMERDFPVAIDLTTAVGYMQVEEEIAQQLGHEREPAPPVPTSLSLLGLAKELPTITIVSRMAQEIEDKLDRNRIRRKDIARWLFFLSLGALGLSLGVAYLLTHLYRVQPFPEFAYYVTLQFIPRPLRGALFILLGAALIVTAMRSLLRGTALGNWLNGTRR